MQITLPPETPLRSTTRLCDANAALAAAYPGEAARRQPVHSFYSGAHLFTAGIARRLGDLALQALAEYAPDPQTLWTALGAAWPQALAAPVYSRVVEKLSREPVEDYRIDFEDGYGARPGEIEDAHALAAAREVAAGMRAGALPPFIGIRIKAFSAETLRRSARTLDLFLTALLEQSSGALPDGFVLTLPKVEVPEQSAALAEMLAEFEKAAGLAAGALRFEIMIETPRAIFGADGASNLPRLVAAANGRCTGAHFGAYDYTASCGIAAAHQHLLHPACEFARSMMQAAFAGSGITLSDGGTNLLPVPVHRGAQLTNAQRLENRAAVHDAWRLQFRHIQHSLACGFYQGWDLHPAQLPARYAAVYAFYLQSLDDASVRLKNLVEKAAQATLAGGMFDDAATGRGLLTFFARAIDCGAIDAAEAEARTGLTAAQFRAASFTGAIAPASIAPASISPASASSTASAPASAPSTPPASGSDRTG